MNESLSSLRENELADPHSSDYFSSPSAEGRLTKEQGVKLLRKLISDEAFRARFEQSPPAALMEVGVPQETIAILKPDCIPSRALASIEVLQETLSELERGVATECLSMWIPNAKVQVRRT